MQSRYEDFQKTQTEIVAISSSSVEEHQKLASRLGLAFPVLSDPGGESLRSYGVLHERALPMTDMAVARPAVFLLDEKGIIRKRFLTENWRIRERPEHLLSEIQDVKAD